MKTKIKNILTFFLLFVIFLGLKKIVLADESVGDLLKVAGGSANYKTEDRQLYMVVAVIIKTFLSILGIFFMILSIYGGFTWMNAKGEEAKVTKAKDILQQAVIGIVIVLGSYAITYFVIASIAGSVTTGSGF